MSKVKSGIFGLNALLDGGIIKNSTTVVIGASGAGKTTFATQFLKRGLEQGQLGIFVSLDENKEQIIQEAIGMGWTEIQDYLKRNMLIFIDASGKEFSTFIHKELPGFVSEWAGSDTRIVIDPLTPVIWSTSDRYEQRELMAFLLKEMRKIGTVLATLEEHSPSGDLSGTETVIPMYLADSVIHLRHTALDETSERKLRIVKCRSSRHSRRWHGYKIIGGLGIVIDESEPPGPTTNEVTEKLAKSLMAVDNLPQSVKTRLQRVFSNLRDEDFQGIDVNNILANIINEYGV